MHIEFLLEEPSAEAALSKLLPKMLEGATFDLYPHHGKRDLLTKLPNRLTAYRKWLPEDWRIVVLVDSDQDDCKALKAQMEQAARSVGLVTRTSARGKQAFQIVNRLAIEELEAWFFGDVEALLAAYPGVPATLHKKRGYRDPDAISGGTWEALERVLRAAGHYPAGLPKVEAARNISKHMDPRRNRSKSFQVFRDTLLELTQREP